MNFKRVLKFKLARKKDFVYWTLFIIARRPLSILTYYSRIKVRANHATILLYHRIPYDLFERHLQYITQHYNVISLKDLYDGLNNDGRILPENSLVITFDDGWKNNYSLLSLFAKYNVPVTIFISAGLIDTNRKMWNEVVREDDPALNCWLTQIKNSEKNDILKMRYDYDAKKEFNKRDMLNREEINDMMDLVDFQSHGMFHPVFPNCDETELMIELSESKKIIENITGKEVYAIAFPYGLAGDREIALAKKYNYRLSRITNDRLVARSGNQKSLPAVDIPGDADLRGLKNKLLFSEIQTIKVS